MAAADEAEPEWMQLLEVSDEEPLQEKQRNIGAAKAANKAPDVTVASEAPPDVEDASDAQALPSPTRKESGQRDQVRPSGANEESQACIAQLVQLLFGGKAGHEKVQARVAGYMSRQATQTAFPRRLFILRGPSGIGKSAWAEKALLDTVDGAAEDILAARLTHVCAVDDFSMHVNDDFSSSTRYVQNPEMQDANHVLNETRVRLAMDLGIEPLYVDNLNLTLWDIRPYVLLADRMGYTVTIVSPDEISPDWRDIDFLVARNEDSARQSGKVISRSSLHSQIQQFEDLLVPEDPCPSIRVSEKTANDEQTKESKHAEAQTLLPPCAVLYKLETLLKEGSNLERFTPEDGKGWGVHGEVSDDWHSFKERVDGSCLYEEGNLLAWQTGVPDTCWTLADLSLLDTLKFEANALPKAVESAAKRASKAAPFKATPVSSCHEDNTRNNDEDDDSDESEVDAPAMSRKERLKHRMLMSKSKVGDSHTAPSSASSRASPSIQAVADFFATVRSRLVESGQGDQYEDFVGAIAGSADAIAAVRILADQATIKAERLAEDDTPHPPAAPPGTAMPVGLGRIKQELGAPTPSQKAWGLDGDVPHPPAAPPPKNSVKAELFEKKTVKSELGKRFAKTELRGSVKAEGGKRFAKAELGGTVKIEDIPRPPSIDPRAPRHTVTVGDDGSDDDMPDEGALAAAVSLGRESCIAELAKLVFRKERLAHEGARPRLSMVRYATKRAACPRFPRELFILRGAPGIGKTDYARQQLGESVDIEPSETEAARLTHICAVDDFFETFGENGAAYEFKASKLEVYHARNEARVRLAMEAGLHPLYVDCPNMKLWEMRPYVKLADRLGYVITVVDPHEIARSADDLSFLTTANDTVMRHTSGKSVSKVALAAMLRTFEQVPDGADAADEIRVAVRPPGESRVVESRSAGIVGRKKQQQRQGLQQPAQKRLKVKAEW
eukprot:TRINITY_DN26642_c0_g3_i1.p1 TRINITY_DN26642_c0_g3~~TRINITY_DN26642_c0_g3_i1.p1  ORF type:complete len:979 (-),score=142.37 TRINITY_DN26642_c0_g3_i1:96-2957(-)